MDPVFRVSVELHFERRIEIIDGVQEADNTRRDKVVETDVIRQTIVNPARDQPDLRKMGEHHLLTPQCGGGVRKLPRCVCRGAHRRFYAAALNAFGKCRANDSVMRLFDTGSMPSGTRGSPHGNETGFLPRAASQNKGTGEFLSSSFGENRAGGAKRFEAIYRRRQVRRAGGGCQNQPGVNFLTAALLN
jgi:hypothetical protein